MAGSSFVGILTIAGLASALSASPLNKNDAVQAQLRLQKLEAFVGDQWLWMMNNHFTSCKARAQTFKETCIDRKVSASTCKKWKCSSPSYTNQSKCEANSATWMEDGNANNSICCNEGNLECGFDAAGQESGSCCEACLNSNHADYGVQCTMDGIEGPSVCGTEKGKCFQCIGFPDQDSQASCTSSGSCNRTSYHDQNSCTQAGGKWMTGVWQENMGATSEQVCLKDSYCGFCNSSTHHDKSSCKNSGNTWSVFSDAASESACNAKAGHYKWIKSGKWEAGKELPASPMAAWEQKTSCSTGPSHELDGLADELTGKQACVDEAKFLQDAASDMTAQEAVNASPFYYKSQVHKTWIGRAIVTNSPKARDRAEITLASTACFTGVLDARNRGKIKVNGGMKTTMLIYNATNYADADEINVDNAAAIVLGGKSAGPIIINTTKKIEVYGIENSGDIKCSGSQDIVIASVNNKAHATITVTDVTAALINVKNDGTVLVKGPVARGGKYHAFDIVNNGNVTIEAGVIDIHTICPSSGRIDVSAGVSGNISFEAGCKGTINAPDTVILQEVVKTGTVIKGDLGMSVPDADAFVADTVALNAVAEGIADTLGVQTQWVQVMATKARRLQGEPSSQSAKALRRLAGTAVTVSYTVNIPPSASSAVASAASGKASSASTAALTQNVQAKLSVAKSPTYTITVTSKAAPAVSEATTTTTTTTSTTSATSTVPSTTAVTPLSGSVRVATSTLPLIGLTGVVFAMLG